MHRIVFSLAGAVAVAHGLAGGALAVPCARRRLGAAGAAADAEGGGEGGGHGAREMRRAGGEVPRRFRGLWLEKRGVVKT